jgi:hypothetical protein
MQRLRRKSELDAQLPSKPHHVQEDVMAFAVLPI